MDRKRILTIGLCGLTLVLLLATPALSTESDLASADSKSREDSGEKADGQNAGKPGEEESAEKPAASTGEAAVCDPDEASFNTLEDFFGLAEGRAHDASSSSRPNALVEWRPVAPRKPAEDSAR